MGTEAVEVSRSHIMESLDGQAKEVRCFLRTLRATGRLAASK